MTVARLPSADTFTAPRGSAVKSTMALTSPSAMKVTRSPASQLGRYFTSFSMSTTTWYWPTAAS